MINFKTVKWKNLLSTGNVFTTVQLDRHPTTLIIGKNGSGKSTVLDALTFGLFGKPFRNINKPNLLNSINKSDMLVEIEFTVGSKEYRIVRGAKPNIFEIYVGGNLLNQDAKAKDYQDYLEKSILKMNYKSFTQIVILGSSSFVPFMQLATSERRAIIEDLLDIQIFSSMNLLLKQRLVTVRDKFVELKHQKELLEVKIEAAKKNIADATNKTEEEILIRQESIKENQLSVETITSEIGYIQTHISALSRTILDQKKTLSKSKQLSGLEAQIENNVRKIKKDIHFFEENGSCPTCLQEIEKSFKSSRVAEYNVKLDNLKKGLQDIDTEIAKTSRRLDEIKKTVDNIQAHETEIVRRNQSVIGLQEYTTKLQNEISQLQGETNSVSECQNELNGLLTDEESLCWKEEETSKDKHYYEVAANLLKDTGIKTKIIKQYLPLINEKVNKYLSSMDFFVNFHLDENFSETIKSRFRDEFMYGNFSEGEKQRIDLALLFTWREVARMKNSVNTNLIILDEVLDASLDAGGTEELLKILNTLGETTNLFVISHHSDLFVDKFRSIIEFQKLGNFSQMAVTKV